MTFKPLLVGAMFLGTVTVPLPQAIGQQSNQDRFDQQVGNEAGVPITESAGNQEPMKKRKDPSGDQRVDHNAQIIIGGAKSTVFGQIDDIRGNYYYIKDEESGEEIRLLVDWDTNLDCSTASAGTEQPLQGVIVTDRHLSVAQTSRASDRQRQQGQREDETAMGSGFRIGACAFKPGNRVKAEVDDMGRTTTLRLMGDQNGSGALRVRSFSEGTGTGELAIPGKQDKPGQLDMTGVQGYPPKQYSILPVPVGELRSADEDRLLHSAVKDLDGTVIGSLERLMLDSNTGQIEYAVVSSRHSHQMEVVPWAYMKIVSQAEGPHVLVVNTREFQLSSDVANQQTVDHSPAMERMIKDAEGAEAPADLRNADLPIADEQTPSRHKSWSKSPRLCVNGNCQVVRGRVVKFQDNMLFIKERAGTEVRTVVDKKTHRGQMGMRDEPQVGDWIEAYVTPKGHAESISLLRAGSGMWNEGEG